MLVSGPQPAQLTPRPQQPPPNQPHFLQERIYVSSGFHGQAVKWSPFPNSGAQPPVLACVANANYGLVGNGALYILNVGHESSPSAAANNSGGSGGPVLNTPSAISKTAIFDVAWSELRADQLMTANGDGSISLYQSEHMPSQLCPQARLIATWPKLHRREVTGIHWNSCQAKDKIVTCSWDGKLCVRNVERPEMPFWSVLGLAPIHKARWSPHHSHLIASAGVDGVLSLWDVRNPTSASHSPVSQISIAQPRNPNNPVPPEITCIDWLKYSPLSICTGSSDGQIRGWDLRNASKASNTPVPSPLFSLSGHTYGLKSICCSPHSGSIIASCSYDMTWRIWDLNTGHHWIMEELTEFPVDLDFNLFEPNLLSVTAWDSSIRTFKLAL